MDTIREYQVWLVYALPLLSFVLIVLHYALPVGNRPSPRALSAMSIVLMFFSFLFALWTLKAVSAQGGHSIGFAPHRWVDIGALRIDVGLHVDGLTAVMLVVVTFVALLVQVYSVGYMEGDPGYPRYYAFLSLFTAAMLGLVLGSTLIMVFIHWELVGLCSYQLIGFWFYNPARPGYTSPAAAAKKAFIVTRFGDLGFLIAILFIWSRTGTFNIVELQDKALAGGIGSTVLTLFALGVFMGAAGKSAQFPFQVWLPDAMEGPTPVSALIHAATMVAAGVYLVARLFPIFSVSHSAMAVVAAIGATTAVVGATMGLVMNDIKRVLAYSTISQLGYMMLALGSGGLVAGIFHLMNHAFFKALLFLGSGSVNHATNTFDMRKMGGLKSAMPITFTTFVIASLSLAGIFPFSGFWSKDEVLLDAWHYNKFAYAAGLAVVFMTAFYMFRAIFMTFFGEYRGGEIGAGHGAHGAAASVHGDEAMLTASSVHGDEAHAGDEEMAEVVPHESPLVMWLPLVLLGVLAVISGFVNAGGFFGHSFAAFVNASLPEAMREGAEHGFSVGLASLSMAFAVAGIGAAAVLYAVGNRIEVPLPNPVRPLYVLFARKYYMDDLYEQVIVTNVLYRGLCRLCAWFDATVVDGIVNGAGRVTRLTGRVLRLAQTGSEQSYGLVLTGGAALVVVIIFVAALR
jgi:NADH-quinone oxidoreductase subunit L